MMDRRIASSRDQEDFLDSLTSGADTEAQVFETKQKVFMFAAALGKRLGTRISLERRAAATAIRYDIFEKAVDESFINSLAICEEGLEILSPQREEDRITIFEEYLNGGLVELKRLAERGSLLEELIRQCEDALLPSEEEIRGVDPAVLRIMTHRDSEPDSPDNEE